MTRLTFSLTSVPSGVAVAPLPTSVCTPQGDGSSVCTVAASVTPTGTSGSFQYRVHDGLTNSATVSVYVDNAAPAAVADRVVVPAAGGTVMLRATDAEGDALTFSLTSVPSGVAVAPLPTSVCTPQGDGSSVCTVAASVTPTGTSGSFQYRVNDGPTNSSTVSVSVTSPAPYVVTPKVVAGTSGAVVALGAVDPNGDPLTFQITGTPSGATVTDPSAATCNPQADGSVYCYAEVTVVAAQSGWSFSFTAGDGLSTASGTVSGTNTVPTVADVAIAVPSTTSQISLTGTDPDGDDLTFMVTDPYNGDGTVGTVGPVTCALESDGTNVCTAEVPFTPGALDGWNFNYTVSDGASSSSASIYVVRQSGADQPPSASYVYLDIVDGPNEITLTGTDPEGADVTFAIDEPPFNGTLSAISTPSCGGGQCTATVTYTPDGLLIDDSFTYVANDGALDSSPATVTLRGDNEPHAYSQWTKITFPTTALTLQGYDYEGSTLTFAVDTAPTSGTVTIDGPPTCDGFYCTQAATYSPDPGYTGADSFTFTVSDAIYTSSPASVNLTGNESPDLVDVAPNRVVGTTTMTITVAEPDGDPMTIGLGTPPADGSFGPLSLLDCVGQPDGSAQCTATVEFTPDPAFEGYDYIEVTLDDGINPPVTRSEVIQIGDRAPTTKTDVLMTDPDTAATVTVSANDRDPDGDPLSLDASTDGAGGIAVCTDDGLGAVDCTYTPNPGFEGLDVFTYTLVDSYGASSIGRVDVTVQAGGSGAAPTDCPTVASALDGGGIVTGENWVECSSPTANGVVQQFTPLLDPASGSALLLTSGDRGIAPGPSYGGGSGRSNGNELSAERMTCRCSRSISTFRTARVVCGSTWSSGATSTRSGWARSFNDAFLAELDTNSWSVSGSDITAPDNFAFDPDGNVLSINSTFFAADRVVTEPDNGMEYDGATQRLVVQTPITAGVHTVYFTVFDAGDHSLDTGALIDNLRAVVPGPEGCTQGANRPPVVTDSAVTVDEDTTASITVDAVDDDGDTLTAEAGTASHGTVTVDGPVVCTDGVCQIPVSYVPDPDVNIDLVGTDSFAVTVSDGHGGIAAGIVSVTITPIPDLPVAADMVESTDEDTPLDLTLVGDDADGTPVTFALTGLPLHGSVDCVDSACTYTPADNYAGADGFGYTVSSGGDTVAGTVTIDVVEVNDLPVAVIDAASTTLPEGTSVGLDATGSSDVDGTIVGYVWQVTGGGTITNPTSATPTLNGVDDASVTVTLTVTDDDGAIDVTTLVFTVTNVSPTVDAGSDLGIQPGDLATLTVGFSDPGIIDSHTATVDWGAGDGVEDVGGVTRPTFDVSHTYATEGEYTVEVCVADDFPVSTCDSVLVTVELVNVPPTVLAGGPYTLTEGEVGLLAGSVLDDDGNLDPSTILWTAGGGAQVGFGDPTAVDSTVTGYQDGVFSLTLSATDLLGAPGSAATTLSVTNVAPTISSFVVTDGVAEGSTVAVNAVFSDPGTFDPHTATVDWTYPSTAAPVGVDDVADLVSTTHVYPQDGTYDVRLCITDDDDTTCQTTQISVVNVAPTVESVSGGSVVNGGAFDLTATFSDPGADSFTATIDWDNDGIDDELVDPASSPITSSHTYPGVGLYTVEVCVSDGIASGCATASVDVTAFNQAPIAIDDFATVAEGTGDRVLDVLGNDNDPESAPLSIVSNTDPDAGTVSCDADDCTFNAPGGFVGTTTFDYTISDGEKQDTATVTIDVVGCADLTGAFSESNVTVTGYEWVECASPAASATAGADLTPLVVPDGTLAQLTTGLASESFGTPGDVADENLAQQFRGAFDASVLRLDLDIPLDTNCLAFDVVFASEEYPDYVNKPYNDGFLAELGASTWSVVGSTIIAPDNFAFDGDDEYISVKGSFFDPGRVVTDTGMSYNGSTAVLRVQTPINTGPNSLFLSIFDGADAFESSAALIEGLEAFQSNQCNPGAGQPPIAVDDDYTLDEDSATLLDVVANDVDPEGAAVTIFDVVTPPQHGTVVPNAERTAYTYVPAFNYYGPDSFEYSITDIANASETEPVADVSIARVVIQVDEVNDPPNAFSDSAPATGSPVAIDVLANDYDADASDRFAIVSNTDPLFGTVTCATTCTYTPMAGYDGPDRFTYTVVDSVRPGSEDPALASRGATDTATVYINSTVPPDDNIPPVADVGGPYTADACPMGPCLPTVLDGSGSFDPDGTYVTYSWFVAPSPPSSLTGVDSVSPSFFTSANGSFQVYLIVYDADGAWDWDSTSASAFAASVGAPGGASSIDEGSDATATIDFFNPGGDLTTTIDWGDGSGIETIDFSVFPVVKTHPYPQDGNFPLEICVRGVTVDGPVDLCDTPTLVVDNVLPAVDAGVDRSLVVGGTLVQNRMSFVDPGADAPWTASVDWGDGSPAEPLVVDDATGLITMPAGHLYATVGLYTVTVCVVDDDAPGCDDFDVNVSNNVPPIADAGGPYSVAEGDTVTLDASGSVDSDGTVTTWLWDAADQLVTLTGAETAMPDFSAADDGDFDVTLQVCDDLDACSDAATVTVTVTNEAPVVDAGGNQVVDSGVAAVLLATFTDSGSADSHTASIDWGDGTVESGVVDQVSDTVSGSHTYAAVDVYTVTVMVTDDDGDAGVDSFTVSSAGSCVPLVHELTTGDPALDDGALTVGVDALGAFGTSVTVSDARWNPLGPLDEAGTVYSSNIYLQNLGDLLSDCTFGDFEVISQSPTELVTRTDLGDLVIELTQTAAATTEGAALTQTYTISNVSATDITTSVVRHLDGDLDFDGTLIDGGAAVLDGSVLYEFDSSDDPNDPSTFVGISGSLAGESVPDRWAIQEFDYRPTITSNGGIPAIDDAVVYHDNDADRIVDTPYDVTLSQQWDFTVAAGASSEFVTVTTFGEQTPNWPPVADPGGPYVVDEGSTVLLDGSGSFDSDGTVVSYLWSPGTDLDDATLENPTFTGVDDGVVTMSLQVTDAKDAVGSTDTSVTVNNVPPVVNPVGPLAATVGELLTLPTSFTDAGMLDTHVASVDWGDGSPSDDVGAVVSPFDAPHTYASPGTYTATVTVTDDDGGIGTIDVQVDVEAVDVNLAPVLDPIGDRSVDELESLTFAATATDGDVPPDYMVYSLEGAPPGAYIDDYSGAFTWTTRETDGPGTYTFDVVVTDYGSPRLEDRETITVTVNEVNLPPQALTATQHIGTPGVGPAAVVDPDYAAATAGQTVEFIDFDGDGFDYLAPNTFTPIPSDTYAAQGVTLLGLDARSVLVSSNWTHSVPIGAWQTGFSSPTDPYSFVFDTPVASFGMFGNDIEGNIEVTVHLVGGGTDTFVVARQATLPNSTFLGYTADSNVITSIDFYSGDYHIIDDVRFGRIVGAPATDYEVDEGTELSFTTPADDPDLPAQVLTFSLDGAPAGASIDAVTGVFTWTPGEADGPGVFTFDVVVTDDGVPSLEGRRTVTVTVNDVNDGPAAVIAGGSTVIEGSTMVLDGVGSSDIDGTIVAYAWSVSSGAVLDDAGVVSPMLTGVDDAAVTVTLTVTDDDGATATTTHEVSVTNAPPVVTPAGPLSAAVGVSFTLPTSFGDAGALDIHAASVDWGDGSSADEFAVVSSPFDATHTYSTPGSYTATVSVTDDDGGVGTVDVVMEVTETLPNLVVTPSTAVVGTGVSQTFDVEGFDPLGNSLGDRTAEAVFTISPNGRCTLNACRSGTTGVKVVTARIGTLTATAILEVRTRQTISFPTIGNTTMLDSPIVVRATASSGLAVTFSTTTPDVCTPGGSDGSTITLLGAGTCTVRADQAGDANWAPAVSVFRNSTVRTVAQSITFPWSPGKLITESPVLLSATASSGLPVTFTTTTPDVCTAGGTDGSTITLLDAGTCRVRAEQPGDSVYRPARAVDRQFAISKLTNAIAFPTVGSQMLADSPVTVVATASSGLPVTFSTTTPDVCTAGGTDGSMITLLDVGRCTVRAEQAGDSVYRSANAVNRSFTVRTLTQRITFPAIGTRDTAESPVTVTAVASSGLPVTFTTTTPDVCTAGGTDGSMITLLDVGRCTVRAEQAGDAYWAAASAVNRGFNVTLPPLTVESFDASPTVLSSVGGTVDLWATVSFAETCRFSVSPALDGFPLTVPCTDGTASAVATLPTNSRSNSRNYTFRLSALRPGAPTATANPIVVRVAPAGESVADLSVSATESADPARTGQPLTYTFTILNSGPNEAPGVEFSATLPSGVTFVSATATQGSGCTDASGVINCALDSTASGDSAVVTIVVVPNTTGQRSITGSVMSAATDADPTNNDATLATLVFNPTIVYTDDATGTVRRVEPYGSSVALTTQPGAKSDAVVSPDGQTVAYWRQGPGPSYESEIWMVGIDGTNERFVATVGVSMVLRPSWSPDSSKIVFSVLIGGKWKATVASAVGDPNPQLLIPDMTYGESAPAYSPDGSKIIFRDSCQRPTPAQCRYHLVESDGSGSPVPYTAYSYGGGVVWDPGGVWFYFAVSSTIYRARVDGSLVEPVVTGAYGGTYWSLSPDGNRIAYTAHVGGKNVISVVDVDGSNGQQLTTAYNAADPAGCYSPVWTPDQTAIIMHCYPGSGAIGIYRIASNLTTPTAPTGIGGSFRSRNPELAGTRPTH